MKDKDINELVKGLDRLHILQAIAERAARRQRIAQVNAVQNGSETTWDVDYGQAYTGRRKDFSDDDVYKWCRNIQTPDMGLTAPSRYLTRIRE